MAHNGQSRTEQAATPSDETGEYCRWNSSLKFRWGKNWQNYSILLMHSLLGSKVI
jgi:hypothetical protein